MLFSKNRFKKKEYGNFEAGRFLLPVATFAVVFVLLIAGVSSINKTSAQQELENLETAVLNSAVQCYALEGRYPESLEYLQEHYGITYDESRYMVSYQAYGSNMLPTITVLSLK